MSQSAKPADARNRLSHEAVARAALEFLDRHGLEELSMRRLATELGVGTMTLYGYFRSKDELLDAVVDAAVAERPPVAAGGPWQERLRALMRGSREGLDRHPAIVKVRMQRPVLRPEALRFCEQTMALLAEAGLGTDDAARTFRLLFTYVLGYSGFSPQGSEEDAARTSHEAMRALPPGDYPAMHAARDELARAMAGTGAFEFGLDVIVAGIERLAPPAG